MCPVYIAGQFFNRKIQQIKKYGECEGYSPGPQMLKGKNESLDDCRQQI
jgi:hypothetical protein